MSEDGKMKKRSIYQKFKVLSVIAIAFNILLYQVMATN